MKITFRQYRILISQAVWFACVFLSPSLYSEELLDSIVAIVDNETITQRELSRNLANAKAALKKQNITAVDDKILLAQTLQQLITRKLQLQEAKRLNISIDEITLDRAIVQMAQNYQMTLDQFRQRIHSEGGDYEAAREQIHEQLTITRLVQREVINKMEVSEEEIKNYLTEKSNLTQEKSEYHLAHWKTVPRSSDKSVTNLYKLAAIRLRNILTDESITSFARLKRRSRNIWSEFWRSRGYATGKSDVKKEQKLPIPRYTLVDLGWKKSEELSETMRKHIRAINTGEGTTVIANSKSLNWFYLFGVRNRNHSMKKKQYHIRHILLQTNPLEDESTVRERLVKMKRAIEKNGDFKAFARKYSQDRGSSFKGGDLGWNDPKNFVAEFASAITQAGGGKGVVGPFKSSFGWHLLEVLGEREQDVGDEMARHEAIAEIKKNKLAEEQRLWLLNLRENHHIEVRL